MAVVYALDQAGWQITLAARRPQQAKDLLDRVVTQTNKNRHIVIGLDAEAIRGWLVSSPLIGLVVNTTPMGMYPEVATNPWPERLPLPETTFVYDLVYNPRDTALVKLARESGLPAASGLGMLVEQAARSFERWTGLPAPVEIMYRAAGIH